MNEITDHLAKHSAKSINPQYGKIPKSAFLATLKELGRMEKHTKRARTIFSYHKSRLKIHITPSSELTTMLIGHGRLKACYHRFRIIEYPTCTCGEGSQTVHHVLYDYKLYKERTQLKGV